MTVSSRFLVFALVGSLPVGLTLVNVPFVLTLVPTLVLLALALADRIAGGATPLDVTRRVGSVLSVGTGNPVVISVHNTTARPFLLQVADETPVDGSAEPLDARLNVRASAYKTTSVTYSFSPEKRGKYTFEGIWIQHASRLGFWTVKRRIACLSEINVYPNIEALHRFELLARVNNLNEIGVRTIRMKGEGTEFERLREYRQGDEPRKVDWKATARMGKLIVREMGQDRNQNLLLMIDMGRMMRQTTGGLSHFDYALNTAIILGHIAARRGDNVGAVLFSDTVKRFVALGRGRASVDAMVRACYDVEPEPVATNYSRMFRYVAANVRKRSLLVMMTHLVPGEDRLLIRSFLKMLGRQHLPLCLFFREPALEEQVNALPVTPEDAFRRAAAADILLERHEGLASLTHAGVMAVDTLPGELSNVAIGQYLDIKARNLL